MMVYEEVPIDNHFEKINLGDLLSGVVLFKQ